MSCKECFRRYRYFRPRVGNEFYTCRVCKQQRHTDIFFRIYVEGYVIPCAPLHAMRIEIQSRLRACIRNNLQRAFFIRPRLFRCISVSQRLCVTCLQFCTDCSIVEEYRILIVARTRFQKFVVCVNDLENKGSVTRDRPRKDARRIKTVIFKIRIRRKYCVRFVRKIDTLTRRTRSLRQRRIERIGNIFGIEPYFHAVFRVRSGRPYCRKYGVRRDRHGHVLIPGQIVARFRPRGSRYVVPALHFDGLRIAFASRERYFMSRSCGKITLFHHRFVIPDFYVGNAERHRVSSPNFNLPVQTNLRKTLIRSLDQLDHYRYVAVVIGIGHFCNLPSDRSRFVRIQIQIFFEIFKITHRDRHIHVARRYVHRVFQI